LSKNSESESERYFQTMLLLHFGCRKLDSGTFRSMWILFYEQAMMSRNEKSNQYPGLFQVSMDGIYVVDCERQLSLEEDFHMSFHLVDVSVGWNLPSSAFCKAGFVDRNEEEEHDFDDREICLEKEHSIWVLKDVSSIIGSKYIYTLNFYVLFLFIFKYLFNSMTEKTGDKRWTFEGEKLFYSPIQTVCNLV
ncbi:hypothetical protein STEG23_013473, partial [Scotinomys teguina]